MEVVIQGYQTFTEHFPVQRHFGGPITFHSFVEGLQAHYDTPQNYVVNAALYVLRREDSWSEKFAAWDRGEQISTEDQRSLETRVKLLVQFPPREQRRAWCSVLWGTPAFVFVIFVVIAVRNAGNYFDVF